MRAREFIIEGRNHPVIAVDVQYTYLGGTPMAKKIIDFVGSQTGPVLMYYNGGEEGAYEVNDIKEYWEYFGFNPQNWNRVELVNKGYGYFRNWMGVKSDATIIKVIREMYRQRVSRTSQLYGGRLGNNFAVYDTKMSELMGSEYKPSDVDEIHVNWTDISQLKRYSGAYLVGGLRNQCLREVELLMNAFNIRYKRIDSLVYG